MANNPKLSIASRNLALNAALDVLNSGFFDVYDSTQPTDADTAIGAQVKLASLTLNATAFGAASAASKTAGAIGADTDADATGTTTWCTLIKSDHTTRVWDLSSGTSSADVIWNTVSIVIHANVAVTSLVASQAA